MERIAELSGQEYVEEHYAADIRSPGGQRGLPEARSGTGRTLGKKPKPRFLRYRL